MKRVFRHEGVINGKKALIRTTLSGWTSFHILSDIEPFETEIGGIWPDGGYYWVYSTLRPYNKVINHEEDRIS